MNMQLSVIAIAMTTAIGISNAQESMELDSAQPATLDTDSLSPMTRSERAKEYLVGTFGRKAITTTAMRAELGQALKQPKEWDRNPAGFGARFGSAFAQHVVRGTLHYGASMALHEDDRYVRSQKTGFWKRSGYAIVNTFVARRDNGRRMFAYARFGSAGGSAFIARTWLPRSVATAGAAASSFGFTIAFDVGSNMFREFWPDLKQHFRRH